MRTLQASSEIESLHWLNYADRDKISAVDQLILTTSNSKDLLDEAAHENAQGT
jgi:hypothetical protein